MFDPYAELIFIFHQNNENKYRLLHNLKFRAVRLCNNQFVAIIIMPYLTDATVTLTTVYTDHVPASVAQSDARPTGDQEVRVRPPPRSATFFHGD